MLGIGMRDTCVLQSQQHMILASLDLRGLGDISPLIHTLSFAIVIAGKHLRGLGDISPLASHLAALAPLLHTRSFVIAGKQIAALTPLHLHMRHLRDSRIITDACETNKADIQGSNTSLYSLHLCDTAWRQIAARPRQRAVTACRNSMQCQHE